MPVLVHMHIVCTQVYNNSMMSNCVLSYYVRSFILKTPCMWEVLLSYMHVTDGLEMLCLLQVVSCILHSELDLPILHRASEDPGLR